jgi:hypothetical protein
MTTITTSAPPRLFEELDFREGDGLEVSLLWNREADSLSVLVVDARTDESFELDVTSRTALDVFRHPFAYAPFATRRPTSDSE